MTGRPVIPGVPVVRFHKYEGLANDFIVVDDARHFVTAEAAVRLCDRRRGIGADGVLTVLAPRAPSASLRMHVYNADGSVAEMCGNGLRCIVRHHLQDRDDDRMVVDTDGGLREGWLTDDGMVGVTMGEAALIERRVDLRAPDAAFAGTAVSLGNPHLVLDPFPPGTDLMRLAAQYGPTFERHPMFPERVNVGFATVDGPQIRLVVFERGSGITEACGTGASAAAAVALAQGWLSTPSIRVRLPGGPLLIDVRGDPSRGTQPGDVLGEITAQGDARRVYGGQIEVSTDELVGALST